MTDWLYDGDRFFREQWEAVMYVGLDPIMWVSESPEGATCRIEEVVPDRHWRVTWGEPQEAESYVQTHDIKIIHAGFGWRVIERDAPRLRVVR
jgi:hypothetical protein